MLRHAVPLCHVRPCGGQKGLTRAAEEQHVHLLQEEGAEGVDLREEPEQRDHREAVQKHWKGQAGGRETGTVTVTRRLSPARPLRLTMWRLRGTVSGK